MRLFLVAALLVSICSSSLAAPIVGPGQISFFSASGVDRITAQSFENTVDGIVDNPGGSPPFNGVSLESYPLSVTYNFNRPYDLESFFLHGEVGTNPLNAIKDFQLVFFDDFNGGGSQIGGVFAGRQTNPTTLQEFDLGAGIYNAVLSFEFFALSVHDELVPGRVEYSVIQFSGIESVIDEPVDEEPLVVSEPNSLGVLLMGLIVLGLAGSSRSARYGGRVTQV